MSGTLIASKGNVDRSGHGYRFLTKVGVSAFLDSLLQVQRRFVSLHAVEVEVLRFPLRGGASRSAGEYRSRRETDLVAILVYLSSVRAATFVSTLPTLVVSPVAVRMLASAEVVEHVAETVAIRTFALVALEIHRDLLGLPLAFAVGQGVACDEFLWFPEQTILGAQEIVGQIAVEITAETANRVAIFV